VDTTLVDNTAYQYTCWEMVVVKESSISKWSLRVNWIKDSTIFKNPL